MRNRLKLRLFLLASALLISFAPSVQASPISNDAVCGTANGTPISHAPTAHLCTAGSASKVAGSGPWTWSCSGRNRRQVTQCSAPVLVVSPINGSCGMSNGADLTSKPSTNLCTAGAASSVSGKGPWSWTCAGANGGSTASCSALLKANGACGTSNGTDLTSKPSANLCTAGAASSVSGTGPWSWTCAGANGGSTASCSALLKANGACGTSNGTDLISKPSTNLCTTGTASSVTGTGPWSWTCAGTHGGTIASCSALKEVNGVVGSDNGGDFYSLSSTDSNLCTAGTVSSFTAYSNGWTWSCIGSNGGSTVSGLANLSVNGTCGVSNSASVSSAPTTGLCSAGTASSVAGTGPWSWSCAGTHGGSTASCSASLLSSGVNGQCGAANGTASNLPPTTALCSVGTASVVSGIGPWSWACAGSNGGSTASCSTQFGTLASGRVFFISAAGSDSNNGTSKAAPWLHAPGMPTCTGVCASTTPRAGDSYIFRGGDTWHVGNASAVPYTGGQWTWNWSGTIGNPIYIGVDQTWYVGSAWARPVLTGDGIYGDTGDFINLNYASYFTLDDFEFTGMYWDANATVWGNTAYLNVHWASTYYTIEHCYFHGWSHDTYANGTQDAGTAIIGSTYGTNTFGVAYANVFDGSDTARDSFSPIYGSPETIFANVFDFIVNNQGTTVTFHDNLVMNAENSFTDVEGNPYETHPDAWQDNGSCGATFYNNVFHDTATGSQISLGPITGCTDYAFNNVMYNIATTNTFAQGPGAVSNSGGLSVIFNNSIEGGYWTGSVPYADCIRVESSLSTATITNTHCISTASAVGYSSGAAPTFLDNRLASLSNENTLGYTTAEPYVFSPTSATGPTVGLGANEQGVCATISELDAAAGTACLSDTTYGVDYDTTNHTVIAPGRLPVYRPTSAAWDVGAFQYNGN